MTKLSKMTCVIGAVAFMAVSALGIEIRLSPQPLVLSSDVDELTVTANIPYWEVDYVLLDIGTTTNVHCLMSADSCKNILVRCSKDTVKAALGDFDSRSTEILLKLTFSCDGVLHSASRVLRVRR